jgi:Flp pilus assembly protein TadG
MRDLSRLQRRHAPVRVRLRPRRRERTLGQSLVELALIAPVLLILLMGSLQVAYLGYGAVTVDTAAREAGRIAAINLSALHSIAQNGSSYTCAADPSTDSNPICKAVSNNAGLLSGHVFSLVRIDLNVAVANNDDAVPGDVVQIACGGTALSGKVTGIPSGVAQISDSLNGTNATSSDGAGNYTDCLNPSPANGQTQTITISATAGTNGQCTGSTQAVLTKSGSSWNTDKSTYPITLTCPTPTPTPAPTPIPTVAVPTPTPTATPTPTPVSGLPPVGSGPSAASCSTQTPAAGSFVTVTVQYRAGIFVPFLGALLADSGTSYKTLRAVVTVRVNPCTA